MREAVCIPLPQPWLSSAEAKACHLSSPQGNITITDLGVIQRYETVNIIFKSASFLLVLVDLTLEL